MKLTKEQVKKIADLAMIKLTDEEVEIYTKQIGSILEYVQILNEVNVEDIDPTSHIKSKNVFRNDTVGKSLDRKDILEDELYFKTKKK